MLMSFGEFVRSATHALREGGIAEAELKVAWWLEYHSGIPRLEHALRARDPLPLSISNRWHEDLPRFLAHEPWQVVLGVAAFFDMDLEVTADVLIPRPETEQLVELVLTFYDENTDALNVCDVGTGSGCIALALSRMRPKWSVTGVDVSPAALHVAQRNAAKLGAANVQWIQANLLGSWTEPTLDLVVANLPYIAEKERDSLPPDVLREPALALFAPDDGLFLIRTLVVQALSLLKPGGRVALEIGESQGNPLLVFFRDIGYLHPQVFLDYAGRARFITATTPF